MPISTPSTSQGELEVDVLVVGAGAAGMTAALVGSLEGLDVWPHIVVEALNAATKSTGRQHDPAARCYAAGIAVDHEHGTANSTRRDCQLLQGRVQPNRHAVAAQAVKQPGDERIAHQQPGATP